MAYDPNPRTNPKAQGPVAPNNRGGAAGSDPFGDVKIPPKPTKGGKKSVFDAFINAHPIMKPDASLIYGWAEKYKVDPVVAAALFWHESYAAAAAQGVDPHTIMSPTGKGYGVGQINPAVWLGKKTPWGETITQEKLSDPEFNIRFALAYFSSLSGNYDEKYKQYSGGANFTLSSGLPKGYVPTAGPNVTQTAQETVRLSAEEKKLTDPYVAGVDKHGKLVTTRDPSKAMLADGLAVTRSVFEQTKRAWENTFVSFTGKRPSNSQVRNILKNGWGEFTVQTLLSKSDSFKNSPIYKSKVVGFEDAAKDLLPPGSKIPNDLVRQGILYGWDKSDIQAKLRKLPTYVKSNEYKGNVATLANVHQSIMGNPTPGALNSVKDAALSGWSADQYAAWLRGTPEYAYSPEYQTKALKFLQAIGFVTGDQAVLQQGVPAEPANQPVITGAPPKDTRVAGQRGLTNPTDLTATLTH